MGTKRVPRSEPSNVVGAFLPQPSLSARRCTSLTISPTLYRPTCLTRNYRRPKAGIPAVRCAFPRNRPSVPPCCRYPRAASSPVLGAAAPSSPAGHFAATKDSPGPRPVPAPASSAPAGCTGSHNLSAPPVGARERHAGRGPITAGAFHSTGPPFFLGTSLLQHPSSPSPANDGVRPAPVAPLLGRV